MKKFIISNKQQTQTAARYVSGFVIKDQQRVSVKMSSNSALIMNEFLMNQALSMLKLRNDYEQMSVKIIVVD